MIVPYSYSGLQRKFRCHLNDSGRNIEAMHLGSRNGRGDGGGALLVGMGVAEGLLVILVDELSDAQRSLQKNIEVG